MAMATTMYHSELNPLKKVLRGGQSVAVTKQGRVRKLHKAFLRYHDPENWPMLREALKEMGREELIGNGKHHLIPSFQPAGTGLRYEGARRPEGEERAYIHAPPVPRKETRGQAQPGIAKAKRPATLNKDMPRAGLSARSPRPGDADAPPPRRGAGRGIKAGVRPESSADGKARGGRADRKPRR